NLVGLPEEEALRALRKSVLERGKADAGLLDAVREAKREALKTEGLFETVRRDASFMDVAGLRHLRDWIAKRKNDLTPEGRRSGRSRASGDSNWGGWTRAPSTTNTSARASGGCTKRWNWRRNSLRWCCGSTKLKRRLPRPARAATPTPVCRSGCLPHS